MDCRQSFYFILINKSIRTSLHSIIITIIIIAGTIANKGDDGRRGNPTGVGSKRTDFSDSAQCS